MNNFISLYFLDIERFIFDKLMIDLMMKNEGKSFELSSVALYLFWRLETIEFILLWRKTHKRRLSSLHPSKVYVTKRFMIN